MLTMILKLEIGLNKNFEILDGKNNDNKKRHLNLNRVLHSIFGETGRKEKNDRYMNSCEGLFR